MYDGGGLYLEVPPTGRKLWRFKHQFVNQYFAARDVVNRTKEEFGQKIQVDLLLKNIDGSDRVYRANVGRIDHFVPERYMKRKLRPLLVLI